MNKKELIPDLDRENFKKKIESFIIDDKVLYSHYICAKDLGNIQFVWEVIEETIHNELQKSQTE